MKNKNCILALAFYFSAVLLAVPAHAGLVVTFEESGPDVTATLSGSFASLPAVNDSNAGANLRNRVIGSPAYFDATDQTPGTLVNLYEYIWTTSFTNPNIGTSFSQKFATSSTASTSVLINSAGIRLPPSYTPTTSISGVLTWSSASFASLELTPGAYTTATLANGETVTIVVASVPAAPTSLSATAGDGEATVSFTAGADNGAAITNYEYSIDGASTWTALSPADAASPVTITGLTNGTAYQIQLRAVNSVGTGAASASVSVTPAASDADGDGVLDDTDPFPNADTDELDSDSGFRLSTTPPTAGSSCSINSFSVVPESASKAGVASGGIGQAISFRLTGCDTGTAESIDVSIDFGTPPAAGSIAYKVLSNGDWEPITGATITGSVLSYTVQDNGPLDQNPALGTIEDPVTAAVPLASPSGSATPVPVLPLWSLLSLAGLVGLFGFRKLR